MCGIFEKSDINATPMLTIQNNGFPGRPITLQFEAGAIIQAPYWGNIGAVNLNGQSYITIDGGTVCGKVNGSTGPTTVCNGIIRNTLAGSSGQTCPGGTCVYQFPDDTYGSVLVGASEGSNSTGLEIKNLYLGPVYVRRLDNSTEGFNTNAICLSRGFFTDTKIHHNIIEGAGKLILFSYYDNFVGSQHGYYVYNNDLSNMCWGFGLGGCSNVGSFDDIQIFENKFSDWRWAGYGASCHTNGTMIFNCWGALDRGYAGDSGSNIYNNYLHGSLSGNLPTNSASGFISCQDNCGPINIFNNLIVDTATSYQGGSGGIYCQSGGSGGQKIYNNTISRTGPFINIMGDRVTEWGKPIVKNNLLIGGNTVFETYALTPAIVTSDYNIAYGLSQDEWMSYDIGNGWNPVNLATWQGTYGQEFHPAGLKTVDPNLDVNYKPQAGSPVIGAGENLNSVGIAALNSDLAGNPRPGNGRWDIGAYEYVPGGDSTPPSAPTGLTVK